MDAFHIIESIRTPEAVERFVEGLLEDATADVLMPWKTDEMREWLNGRACGYYLVAHQLSGFPAWPTFAQWSAWLVEASETKARAA